MADYFLINPGFCNNERLGYAAYKASVPRCVAIGLWYAILEFASQEKIRGDLRSLDIGVIADQLGMDRTPAESVLHWLRTLNFIVGDMVADLRHFREERRPSGPKWRKLCREVKERDGYRCRYCGSNVGPMHVDHVYPFSLGGSSDKSNLATACAPCNKRKYNRTDMVPKVLNGPHSLY